MKHQRIVQVVTTLVVVVFAVGIMASGDAVKLSWLKFASIAVLVATGVLGVFELWLWKMRLVQKLPMIPIAVCGTWKGTLSSGWIDPATKKRLPDRTVFLTVRQTASAIRVSQHTKESASSSKVAILSRETDDSWTIDYIYFNRPELALRGRSPMHHGGSSLWIIGRPAKRIEGFYWTDRDTKGQLKFSAHRSQLAGDFAEASKLCA